MEGLIKVEFFDPTDPTDPTDPDDNTYTFMMSHVPRVGDKVHIFTDKKDRYDIDGIVSEIEWNLGNLDIFNFVSIVLDTNNYASKGQKVG